LWFVIIISKKQCATKIVSNILDADVAAYSLITKNPPYWLVLGEGLVERRRFEVEINKQKEY